MLNYNLNIIEPLQQEKKNEDVNPYIYWDFDARSIATDNGNLPANSFATMSIYAPNSNCIDVSSDAGNFFFTDPQFITIAAITGSNWAVTGSTTMSLNLVGISFNETDPPIYFYEAVSASVADGNINSVSGSIIMNEFSASEFYNFFISGSVIHWKGNQYNPLVNWKASNFSPVTTTGKVNGYNTLFNIVKDANVQMVNLNELTSSVSSSFNYEYNFGVTSSLSASINNVTGSTTMSFSIPQTGLNVTQQWFNETTTKALLTASFVATDNLPYNITASVINNKGNIKNTKINYFLTGSTPDSYSLYTIPAQYNLVKDEIADITWAGEQTVELTYPVTTSLTDFITNKYAFNQTSSLTGSGQYSGYQVFTNVTESLQLSNSGSTLLVTASVLQEVLTQKFVVNNDEDYNIQGISFIDKVPSLAVSMLVIGGGGGGGASGNRANPDGVGAGGGGGAGGFVQHDLLLIPNKPYTISAMGVGGRGATPTTTGSNGTGTTATVYLPVNLVGAPNQIVQTIIGADGGYTGSNGSSVNINAGRGGESGASSYGLGTGSNAAYYLRNNEQRGGVAGSGDGGNYYGGGGAGTLSSGSTFGVAGINLGGAGGAYADAAQVTGSNTAIYYFQSQSFSLTGSAGNGGFTSSINGTTATALGGGGGGGAGLPSARSGGNGGNGGNGAVILVYSGSARLTVPAGTITTFENGFTQHIITTTGSFSYDYVPVPNPASQPYEWRAELLVVGGGGCGNGDISGGGGAGGYVYAPYTWFDTTKTYNVIVGAGQPSGSAAASGSNSFVFDNTTNRAIAVANGGGKAGPNDGASGGGGSGFGPASGTNAGQAIVGNINIAYYTTASYIQGFAGANSDVSFRHGGGGGGASTTGSAGASEPIGGTALPGSGQGGLGRYSLDFTPVGICGGGQGSNPGTTATGSRAFGGGINTSPSTYDGIPNTGGGGVGLDTVTNGGKGGSGIVQIKYVGTPRATGGVIQTQLASGSYYTLHTFTGSGTFTPLQ